MTDKLAFDVGLQEDATGVGLERGGRRRGQGPRWGRCRTARGGRPGGGRDGGGEGDSDQHGGTRGRECEGGRQRGGGRDKRIWGRGLGDPSGKGILGGPHPDSPAPSLGEACWWTAHPASKQRSEGEKVRVGDDLILVSVSSERYLVSNPAPPHSYYCPGLGVHGVPRLPVTDLPALWPQWSDA